MKEVFKKSVFAGILIGIGGVAYISCTSKIVGALLFSFGLFTICSYGLYLFTGKNGYFFEYSKENKINLLVVLLGNYVGATIVGLLFRYVASESNLNLVKNIAECKLAYEIPKLFVLSVFCGIMMFLAVDLYKHNEGFTKLISIFMGVMIFILAGFEHCIANMFYFSAAMIFSAKMYLYLMVMIIGNMVGSIAIWSLRYYKKKVKQVS